MDCMSGITIRGTGRYLPDRIVGNDDFAAFLDTSDEWIISHTGIERRRVAVDEPVWYMGAQAAQQALEAADIPASEIGLIIGTTVTGDYRFPSMSCLVQDAIGAREAFCFDISAACAASTYALDMARRYLYTGGADAVLIVASEALSRLANYEDRSTCVLFGDGAGACVVTRGEGIFGSYLSSDGAGGKHLFAKFPRGETPFSKEGEPRDLDPFPAPSHGFTVMDGHDVYRFATRAMPKAVRMACAEAGIEPADIDLVIPHQANLRIIEAAARYMKLPMEKVYVNIQDYANTSSATVLIALDECVRSGRIQRGQILCLVGFGAGLVSGSAVLAF